MFSKFSQKITIRRNYTKILRIYIDNSIVDDLHAMSRHKEMIKNFSIEKCSSERLLQD